MALRCTPTDCRHEAKVPPRPPADVSLIVTGRRLQRRTAADKPPRRDRCPPATDTASSRVAAAVLTFSAARSKRLRGTCGCRSRHRVPIGRKGGRRCLGPPRSGLGYPMNSWPGCPWRTSWLVSNAPGPNWTPFLRRPYLKWWSGWSASDCAPRPGSTSESQPTAQRTTRRSGEPHPDRR